MSDKPIVMKHTNINHPPEGAAEKEESEIAQMTSRFEAVQIAMNKDKTGYILKLAVHPNDAPEDLLRDPVGTRYMIVAVRLTDDGQPMPSPQTREGMLAVSMAGQLCRDERFQSWLCRVELADELSEDAAIKAVKEVAQVKSRTELRTNSAARERFLALRDEFADYLRRSKPG